ncbi:hypothetical protein D3C87_607700 [compost metagenome]
MAETTILLDDLCYPTGPFDEWREETEAFEKRHQLSRLLTALLTHDQIIIRIDLLEGVTEMLGPVNTLYLLQHGAMRIIDDGGTSTAFLPHGGINMLMNFSSSTNLQFDAILGRLRKRYTGPTVRKIVESLVYTAGQSCLSIDGAWMSELVRWEDVSDLTNGRVTNLLGFENQYSNIMVSDADTLPLFRLNQANRSLIYQKELDLTTLSTEFGTREILASKFGSYQAGQMTDPVGLFQEIRSLKQLPDLTALYLNNVISIKTIVELRNSVDGRKFREWFESEDYNKAKVYKVLMSTPKRSIKGDLLKHIRWAIPTIIGVFNTPIGVAASFAESYLLGKLLSGWHPNLFLDNILTVGLERHQREARLRDARLSAAGRTGRNSPCPCGSGKKYKKCHGS